MTNRLYPGVRKTDAGHWQPLVFEYGVNEPILSVQAVRFQYEAANIARRLTEDERTRRHIRGEAS